MTDIRISDLPTETGPVGSDCLVGNFGANQVTKKLLISDIPPNTALATALSASTGSTKVTFTQAGSGVVSRTVESKLKDTISVLDFGALCNGADESTQAAAMIAACNYLYVPAGYTLVAKNIQLFNNTTVLIDGAIKLPAACGDFDRLLYATSKTKITIKIKEINGNYVNQSGDIGTHLIYLKLCDDVTLDVAYAHGHYTGSSATMPSIDGTRDSSSGAILLYKSHRANVTIGLLSGWSREGLYLQECNYGVVSLGHAQGVYNTEYSGLQIKGDYNRVVRASVDFAGSSGVGFDTRYGTLSNVISTNTRENSGINFGHTDFPASNSVASNLIVDGAFGYGITVAASSQDVSINNFNVTNAGQYGISFSDNVVRGKLSNGFVGYSTLGSLNAYGSRVRSSNILSSVMDTKVLNVTTTAGLYSANETVTTATGSATVRRAIRNLTNTQQILFLTSITGTFSATQTITGSVSGATGTVSLVNTPVDLNEQGGGLYEDESRYFAGTGDQVRFSDGTAIFTYSLACSYSTANTLQQFTFNYASNVTWITGPNVVVSVGSVNLTDTFTVSRLNSTSTTTVITISLNASFSQIYGIQIIAIGRWK